MFPQQGPREAFLGSNYPQLKRDERDTSAIHERTLEKCQVLQATTANKPLSAYACTLGSEYAD